MTALRFPIADLDVFYISYDEPRREEFWSDLLNKVEWAQRVDGVTGFDAAHKECARSSATERFITIDGDNIVDESFFKQTLEIPKEYENHVLSWAGKNVINGLCYGNGGIKCWTRDAVLRMKSHEAAETERDRVDFCWGLQYLQMKHSFSETHVGGSPYQAYRSGYREGIKLSLNRGEIVPRDEFFKHIWIGNIRRLQVWASVGSDAQNGLWAMYGTRRAIRDLLEKEINPDSAYDYTMIADYDRFLLDWSLRIIPTFNVDGATSVCYRTGVRWNEADLWSRIKEDGSFIRTNLGLELADFGANESKFFKTVYESPVRSKLIFEKE